MSKEENRIPHQLLFDCENLLQELGKKYPESLDIVEKSLKDIMRYYIKEENTKYPYQTARLIYKGKVKPQPYIDDKDELEKIIAKEYVVYD